MQHQYFVLLFYLATGILSCKTTSYDAPYKDPFLERSFTGYNEQGKEDFCRQSHEKDCIDKQTAFESRCKELAYQAFRCSCAKVLCSFNINEKDPQKRKFIFQGYNRLGALLTCELQDKNIPCEANSLLESFKAKCLSVDGSVGVCSCSEALCSLDIATHQ